MLHLDTLSKNILSQCTLLFEKVKRGDQMTSWWRDHKKKKQELPKEITAWPSVLLWNDHNTFLFLRHHQRNKGSSQAYFNSYKVSEWRHAKSIPFPFLSTRQFNGRTKGLAKTIFPTFIRVQQSDTSDPLICYLRLLYDGNQFIKVRRFVFTKACICHKSGTVSNNSRD
jgi:hypothetical protein